MVFFHAFFPKCSKTIEINQYSSSAMNLNFLRHRIQNSQAKKVANWYLKQPTLIYLLFILKIILMNRIPWRQLEVTFRGIDLLWAQIKWEFDLITQSFLRVWPSQPRNEDNIQVVLVDPKNFKVCLKNLPKPLHL